MFTSTTYIPVHNITKLKDISTEEKSDHLIEPEEEAVNDRHVA